MTREIEIGGKPIKFTANGATPVFYKMFFKFFYKFAPCTCIYPATFTQTICFNVKRV